MKTLALDLGGTRIKMGIVDGDRITGTRMIDALSDRGFLSRLEAVEHTLREILLEYHLGSQDLCGIGFSIPGIVDSRRQTVLSIKEKYNDVVGFDFGLWSREKFGLPIFLENDARSALVGEWQFGAGKGCDNLVMMTLGTGVGAAALVEGTLLRGKHFLAGCLGGHMTVNLHGVTCNCGNIGCVESEASTWRLPSLARAQEGFSESALSNAATIDYEVLFTAADGGDLLAQKLLHRSLEAWSAGVINLIHAYDPEMAIIGGGPLHRAEIIIPYLADQVDRRAWTPWGSVRVVKAHDIDNAALRGAAYLLAQSLQ
jgi:glucokinase